MTWMPLWARDFEAMGKEKGEERERKKKNIKERKNKIMNRNASSHSFFPLHLYFSLPQVKKKERKRREFHVMLWMGIIAVMILSLSLSFFLIVNYIIRIWRCDILGQMMQRISFLKEKENEGGEIETQPNRKNNKLTMHLVILQVRRGCNDAGSMSDNRSIYND